MGLSFHILGSSSSGNCTLVKTAKTQFLIDAGFTGKRIVEMLRDIGESIENVSAVFITHEHHDHVCGLRGLARNRQIEFFATPGTAKAINHKQSVAIRWKTVQAGCSFTFEDIQIRPFSIPHDATDPVGYVFTAGGDREDNPKRTLAWATDLGYVPMHVQESVREADVLILESNYDPHLLETNETRPWALKQRIRSRHGHLSNTDALAFIQTQTAHHWKHIVLAHLSAECNDVALVRQQFGKTLHADGRCPIHVIPPRELLPHALDLRLL
jgi:phosphoribosyl 1,2-cyclic phosphodiesterase